MLLAHAIDQIKLTNLTYSLIYGPRGQQPIKLLLLP